MPDVKGISGSFRVNALDAAALGAMEAHEQRADLAGQARRVRDISPLLYTPYGSDLTLRQSYEAHVKGARRNSAATKLSLHGFFQFPTQIEITPESEREMLQQAVIFVNKLHGGNAVYRARLDRDEAGRHGVDVFYAPRYVKQTKTAQNEWISLTKFGKDLARKTFGQRQKRDKDGNLVLDKKGQPVLIWQDSSWFQGQLFQDLVFEHLHKDMNLSWVQRGNKKKTVGPDRLSPELYKLGQEQQEAERQIAQQLEEAEQRELDGIVRAAALARLRVLLAKATLAIHDEKIRPATDDGDWIIDDTTLEVELHEDISLWEVIAELLQALYRQFLKVKQYLDEAQRKLLRDELATDIHDQPPKRESPTP